MTLKAKLCRPFDGLKTETANELEKIADEFAIGFAEWLLVEKYSDLKEVLEIYKKEKGLWQN